MERLLVVVPYILGRQDVATYRGVKVEEIERRFAISPRCLSRDLEFLCSYISPGGESRPDECVDAYVEDGEAFIFGPLSFKAPMALGTREWAALASAGELLGDEGGELGRGLRSLAKRLRRLPRAGGDPIGGRASLRRRGASFSRTLESLRGALHEGRRVSFSYYSRSRDERRERSVSPCKLLMLEGEWYLAACENGERVKTFRLDRITGLRRLTGRVGAGERRAARRWQARGVPFSFDDKLGVTLRRGGRKAKLRGASRGRLLDLYFRSYHGWRVTGDGWFRALLRGKLEKMLENYS